MENKKMKKCVQAVKNLTNHSNPAEQAGSQKLPLFLKAVFFYDVSCLNTFSTAQLSLREGEGEKDPVGACSSASRLVCIE